MSGSLYRMESALGMLSKMSGKPETIKITPFKGSLIATLVDDVGAEMRDASTWITCLGGKELNRAAILFEAADRQSQTVGANRLAIWY